MNRGIYFRDRLSQLKFSSFCGVQENAEIVTKLGTFIHTQLTISTHHNNKTFPKPNVTQEHKPSPGNSLNTNNASTRFHTSSSGKIQNPLV
jgi:hypothetical protein